MEGANRWRLYPNKKSANKTLFGTRTAFRSSRGNGSQAGLARELHRAGNRAPSEVARGQPGIAHDAALGSRLEVGVAVDRHGHTSTRPGVAVDVVTALDAIQLPTPLFQEPDHPLAGNRLHATPSAAGRTAWSWAEASQASAASRRLARTSSSVSPWV